ncbi:MAG TPA: hypothetical protein VFR13_06025 [Jiangellaceae bacterium]|nr:hypothetical protein [Jiangellaceae bacterium]
MGWTLVIGMFLIAHGLVHVAMYAPPAASDAPFDPARSWVFGRRLHRLALVLATITALVLVLAGIGLLAHQDWWQAATVVGASASLVFLVLFFHPWLSLGVAINVAMIWVLTQTEWPTSDMLGW